MIEKIRAEIERKLNIYDYPGNPPLIEVRCSVYKELLSFLDTLEEDIDIEREIDKAHGDLRGRTMREWFRYFYELGRKAK